jgi:hypothetical protein
VSCSRRRDVPDSWTLSACANADQPAPLGRCGRGVCTVRAWPLAYLPPRLPRRTVCACGLRCSSKSMALGRISRRPEDGSDARPGWSSGCDRARPRLLNGPIVRASCAPVVTPRVAGISSRATRESRRGPSRSSDGSLASLAPGFSGVPQNSHAALPTRGDLTPWLWTWLVGTANELALPQPDRQQFGAALGTLVHLGCPAHLGPVPVPCRALCSSRGSRSGEPGSAIAEAESARVDAVIAAVMRIFMGAPKLTVVWGAAFPLEFQYGILARLGSPGQATCQGRQHLRRSVVLLFRSSVSRAPRTMAHGGERFTAIIPFGRRRP